MREKRRLFFKGGVQAEITGLGRERFFNIAARRELFVTGIGTDRDGHVLFWTTGEDYKKMKPAARKAGVRLFLRKKYGLPFFLFRNRKRKPLAAGFICFFLLLYGLSFFIWDISFEGNLRFTDQMLLHYMETLPVACGMRKSAVSCEELEESLRNQFAEITWVSAEIKGTRLTVRIKENEAMLSPVEPDRTPCDLTAEKDGVIERCVVRNGLLKVRAGDPVAAGDLLVAGTIPIYDDSENLVSSHEIRADAEVYARTVYETEKKLPLTYEVKSRTGRVRRGAFFSIFGRTFYFLMPAYGDASWEFFMEERQLRLFEDFCLPVYGGLVTALEYVPYERAYTKEEVSAEKDRYMEEYMEKLQEKGIQILANDGKIEKGESGWKIQGTVTVIEDIAGPVPIPEKHEENQTVNEFN
ncbi:putative uncharacterized protein [Clostridium sp. CAG:58]|nr:putative uncharacterized protein [Clostridium sp. CAG:58]